MNLIERLGAINAIRELKSRYFRGIDTGDGALVRSILAADCELDYMGCCTDPATGRDFIPAMNVVLRGRDAWKSDGMSRLGIVSVHQSHNYEVTFDDELNARAIWSMTDRLFFPPGGAFSLMTGYGHYHDSYRLVDNAWQLRTTRIKRIRVEVS